LSIAAYQDQGEILRILHEGADRRRRRPLPNELRASNFVGFYLKRHGYRVVR
jgi:hypothetical protein